MILALSAKLTRFISTSSPRSLPPGRVDGCRISPLEGAAGPRGAAGFVTTGRGNGFSWGRIVSWNLLVWATDTTVKYR